MKWNVILFKNNVALLQSESDTQYAVVTDYNPDAPENKQWAYGTYFEYWNNKERKPYRLSQALELFRYKTETNYILRSRLEELTTQFKDQIVEISLYDCNATVAETAKIFEEMELEDYEKEFFGLDEIGEDDEFE